MAMEFSLLADEDKMIPMCFSGKAVLQYFVFLEHRPVA